MRSLDEDTSRVRRGRRCACWSAVLLLLASLQACFTPPAVLPATDPEWTLEGSHYPDGTSWVEIPVTPSKVLRGIHVASDAGAPLVVHFAESGSSVTASIHVRGQYRKLAELGFASLAIDYGGVGRSDGRRTPDSIVADARAMYHHALEYVDGDERRLVLRGVSLGSLAAGGVLQGGARPAATVLYAPVLGTSVARRFGYATRSDVFVWLVAPFLRPVTNVDLVETLSASPGELLVFGSAADELVSDSEWERIAEATRAAGGRVADPDGLLFTFEGFPESVQLQHHIGAARSSCSVHEVERELLNGLFPHAPDVDARVARILGSVPPELAQEIRFDASATESLRGLVAEHLFSPPLAMLTMASSIGDVEVASGLLELDAQGSVPSSKRVYATLDPVELAANLDLKDPSGTLPPAALLAARSALYGCWSKSDRALREDWPSATVLALAGLTEDPLSELGSVTAPGTISVVGDPDGMVLMRIEYENSSTSRSLNLSQLRASLESDAELSAVDRRRRVVRVLLKATGHADRLVRTEDGALQIELLRDGLWTPIETGS